MLHHRIRQKREIARALDSPSQHALMLGTIAGGAAGNHFAALRYEIAQDRCVLVIHIDRAVDAKAAHLSAWRSPAAGTSPFTGTIALTMRSWTTGSFIRHDS